MVVISPESDPYRPLAEAIADDRSAELVSTVEDAADGPALYVCHPASLTPSAALALQRRLLEDGPRGGAFGIVTGRTENDARRLYERKPPNDERHCILLRKEDRDIRSPDEETVVFGRNDATVGEMESLDEGGLASLSTMTDGRSIHTFLSDGYLCGYPTVSDYEFEEPTPRCVEDGERNCPLDGDLLPADRFGPSHVFLNSCASTIPDTGTYGLPVHVGMGLLTNAVSLIGGYRAMEGLPEETAFHYALLRAGYTAAERCYLLNRNSHELDLEAYPYVCYGRPDRAVGRPADQSSEVELTRTDGELRIEATDVSAHVVEVEVPNERLPDRTPVLVENRNDNHSDWPLYYAALPGEDVTRVFLYSWGRIEADRLVAAVGTGSLDRRLGVVRRSLSNLRGVEALGLTDRKMNGQLTNLRNQVHGLASEYDRRRYRMNAHRALADRMETVENGLTNVRDRLLSVLDGRGPGFLSDEYGDRVLQRSTSVADEECYHCGRPVFVKEVRDPQRTTRREIGLCPRCINVFDAPSVEGGAAYPRIYGDLLFEGDSRRTVEIEFTNPEPSQMRATVHPWLWANQDDVRGSPVFDPETTTVELAPGETETVAFEVDVGSVPQDAYTLYAYVLGNMDVYLSMRRLLVTED
ncbi:hypothetical protein NGM10_06025 [Halorussus salilacus]|uniref:hypothetical protein n=1 Tax=Halorussus salilacus TaxID=2953750 RepID=UPI00209F04D4|nr:hypothetical protein [Halorussus salilacus]USZ69291.1 hypothetical protein NGM10_06025 [Halorussus salilacus]